MHCTRIHRDSVQSLTTFRGALRDPEARQAARLRTIIERNAHCEFGSQYGFSSIDSYVRFRSQVPVCTYDDLQPAIDRMAAGLSGVLTSEPVCAWEETGGSSGGTKLIPYTQSGLQEFRAGVVPWLASLYATWPECAAGRAYWSISPVGRSPRWTSGGMRIGLPSDVDYIGEPWASRLIAAFAVPPQVATLTHIAQWRRVTLLHLVACEPLALISVWSPTFLLSLLTHLHDEAEDIAVDLRCTPAELRHRHALAVDIPLPIPSPSRAAALLEAISQDPPDWSQLWPELRLISCWNHARARRLADQLQVLFPHAAVQGKGLLATEALVSIPIEVCSDPVLAVDSCFYEFVDKRGIACMACDVRSGEEYELLLTTSAGLYRYALGDRVRVSGYIERTPTLEFIGRSGVVADLCGEKLDDAFVAQALDATELRFAMLIPDGAPLGYRLIMDADELNERAAAGIARRVDDALSKNVQYAYARRLGQLAELRPVRVASPEERWIAASLARGQRLGDIKQPALYARDDAERIFGLAS